MIIVLIDTEDIPGRFLREQAPCSQYSACRFVLFLSPDLCYNNYFEMSQKLIEKVPHISGQANHPMTAPAHALAYENVAEQLNANVEDGLTEEEAKRRLEQYGRNEFGEQHGVQPLKIFIGQIANALTLVSCPTTRYPPP